MKRSVLILCSLCFITILQAQETVDTIPAWNSKDRWTLGLRGGVSLGMMRYSDERYNVYERGVVPGMALGIWSEYSIIKGLSIRPEIDFVGRGSQLSWNDIRYTLSATYFDVRVPIMYTFLRQYRVQPYLLVAPDFGTVLGGSLHYKEASVDIRRDLSKGTIAPCDFSLYFGVGLKGFVRIGEDMDLLLGGEFGYNLGLLNTFSSFESNGTANPVNGEYNDVHGKRHNGNFEIALLVGFPLRNIKPQNKEVVAAPEPRIKRKSAQQIRTEQAEAVREQQERQAEILRLLQEQEKRNQELYTNQLVEYNQHLKPTNRVGSGILMSVHPNVELDTAANGEQELNLKLEFAYETKQQQDAMHLSYNQNTDDYPAGQYLPSTSKACKATLEFIREKLDGELRSYFNPGTKVTIKITGETDGSPIRSTIPYKGEFGSFEHQMIYLNNSIDDISVTKESGISRNAQLGFLRTQGVKQYLETYINSLQATNNTYQIFAVERQEKGSQYRKISVELTIHKAFNEEIERTKQVSKPMTAESLLEPTEEIIDVDTHIPEGAKTSSNRYVLIIANEQYNSLLGEVPFALNDGRIFQQYCLHTLKVPDRQIKLLENATKNQIDDAIDWLEAIANARKGDAKIVIYYAGHGVPIAGKTYLLPTDANPEKASQMIALSELYDRLGQLKVASATCFMDACFSGTKRNGTQLIQGSRGVALKAKEDILRGKTIVFSAADAQQTAYPFAEKKHGIFTYYLLKALQQSKGEITYQDLFDYLSEYVEIESALQNKTQTPTLQASMNIDANEWRSWRLND